jgi:hypothetical protein
MTDEKIELRKKYFYLVGAPVCINKEKFFFSGFNIKNPSKEELFKTLDKKTVAQDGKVLLFDDYNAALTVCNIKENYCGKYIIDKKKWRVNKEEVWLRPVALVSIVYDPTEMEAVYVYPVMGKEVWAAHSKEQVVKLKAALTPGYVSGWTIDYSYVDQFYQMAFVGDDPSKLAIHNCSQLNRMVGNPFPDKFFTLWETAQYSLEGPGLIGAILVLQTYLEEPSSHKNNYNQVGGLIRYIERNSSNAFLILQKFKRALKKLETLARLEHTGTTLKNVRYNLDGKFSLILEFLIAQLENFPLVKKQDIPKNVNHRVYQDMFKLFRKLDTNGSDKISKFDPAYVEMAQKFDKLAKRKELKFQSVSQEEFNCLTEQLVEVLASSLIVGINVSAAARKIACFLQKNGVFQSEENSDKLELDNLGKSDILQQQPTEAASIPILFETPSVVSSSHLSSKRRSTIYGTLKKSNSNSTRSTVNLKNPGVLNAEQKFQALCEQIIVTLNTHDFLYQKPTNLIPRKFLLGDKDIKKLIECALEKAGIGFNFILKSLNHSTDNDLNGLDKLPEPSSSAAASAAPFDHQSEESESDIESDSDNPDASSSNHSSGTR